MIQVALVGGAHIHTPNFINKLNERSDISVKYVWDHDPDWAGRRAEALNSRVLAEVGDIWADEEIAAAIICSETNRREPLALAARTQEWVTIS